MPKVSEAGMASAKTAVDLAIGLAGQMTLWLGFMGVLREAGLMSMLARVLKPLMVRLFPEVPPDHPAMGAMIMNFAANMLGLANAATPFGLKAMSELDKLNPRRGVATNAMALFLAINTSGLAVLALGAVAVRATVGSRDAAGIILPSFLATSCTCVFAIFFCKLTEKMKAFAVESVPETPSEVPSTVARPGDAAAMQRAEEIAAPRAPAQGPRLWVVVAVFGVLAAAIVRHFLKAPPELSRFEVARSMLSEWLLPTLMLAIVTFSMGRKVKVYETFVASAKEGFQIAVTIIPFLVAILVAIGMFRASGAMDVIVAALGPYTRSVGFPPEALPMALMKPLSGSGALAVMIETMKSYGPDSFIGYLVSVLNGSMETTFYVLAVYYGSIQVRVLRHTVVTCLAADLAGIIGATAITHLFFG